LTPRVAIVFTGGTIAMRPDAAAGGAIPSLRGAEIIERTTGLSEIARIEPVDWGLVPASHLSFDQVLDLARVVDEQLARDEIDGAVLVQGTDSIEETAFCLDLVHRSSKPLVVTGAMRNAAQDGYDGPDNMRGAVRCAASPALRDQGVLVVLAGGILPADDAVKSHTERYDTFQALNLGPLGAVTQGNVVVTSRRARRRRLDPVPAHAAEPVALVTAVLGGDGREIRSAVQGGARGIVVAATGAGNTPEDMRQAAIDAMGAGVPVVLTTRSPSGRVRPAYGFPGGGAAWERAGAILAGYLGGPKARVALALGLGAGLDDAGLRRLFADPVPS
jgi:L-asparaginase